jgi:hypothetical protein
MGDGRKLMYWFFALESIICFRPELYFFTSSYVLAVLFSAQSILYGVAWWIIRKRKPSARVWGFIASTAYFLIYFQPIIFNTKFVWWHGLGDLILGVAGLFVFLPRDKMGTEIDNTEPAIDPS